MLYPIIDTRAVGLEVISVTQLSCGRLSISLASESPWEFDTRPAKNLLAVATDGARPD
jgi:hypothetical protein